MDNKGERSRRYLTAAQVRERYGKISEMTLWRWLRDGAMGFPKPTVRNRRRFWDEHELDLFDDAQAPA